MFDNFNVNLRKNEGFLTCISCIPIPEYGQSNAPKDRLSQMAKIVYRAACWDCNDSYIGKAKRRLHDRKTEHFKALINGHHASALVDHVTSTGYSLKWDHFGILGKRAIRHSL